MSPFSKLRKSFTNLVKLPWMKGCRGIFKHIFAVGQGGKLDASIDNEGKHN